jgi:hypothetical protein
MTNVVVITTGIAICMVVLVALDWMTRRHDRKLKQQGPGSGSPGEHSPH